MNIAIIGYGKMGHEIEKVANSKNVSVVSIVDPAHGSHREINDQSMKGVDVCVDFSVPGAVAGNVEKIAKYKKNIVIGTTGWYSNIDEVKKIIEKNNLGLIYAPNFSIGVNVFLDIIKNAARLINKIEDYDIYGYELHHSKKLDSPSGTAKAICDILVENIKRKNSVVFEKLDRKIEPNELHFASVRSGFIPGTHVVGFDSSADTIELKHSARNREGFAVGAVTAAQWIYNKKGFFEIKDMMKDIVGDQNA